MGAKKYGNNSILIVEALGLRDGVRKAKQLGYTNIEIEGDNLTVIEAAKGTRKCPWHIDLLISDIWAFL